jgi:phage-related protein
MITSLDRWIDRFTFAPRVAGAIFDWCVTSAGYDVEPTVLKAQFGDGYAQRRPAGINTQSRIWNVEMRNVLPEIAADVLAFLEARNGVDVFSWAPPRTSKPQDTICPSWSASYGELAAGGTRLIDLRMRFEQVHV